MADVDLRVLSLGQEVQNGRLAMLAFAGIRTFGGTRRDLGPGACKAVGQYREADDLRGNYQRNWLLQC